MRDTPPATRPSRSALGRVATAVVVTSFAMVGVSLVLDSIFDRHGAVPSDAATVAYWTVLGFMVARGVLTDAQYAVGFLATTATIGGIWLAFLTRPWHLWHPPADNALWVTGWVFGSALLGVAWTQHGPVTYSATRTILTVILAVGSLAATAL